MTDSKGMMNANSYIIFFIIGGKRDNDQWNLTGLVKSLGMVKKANKWLTIPTELDEVELVVRQLRAKGLVAYHEAENYKIALTEKGRKVYVACIEPKSTPSSATAPIQFLNRDFPKTYKQDIVGRMLWAEKDKRVGTVEDEIARRMGCSKRSVERGVADLINNNTIEIKSSIMGDRYSFGPSLRGQSEVSLDDISFKDKLYEEPVKKCLANGKFTPASLEHYQSSPKVTSKIDLQLTTPDFMDKLTLLARINHTDVETMALACFNAGYNVKVRESLEPLKGM